MKVRGKIVSFHTLCPLSINYLVNLVLECEKEKCFSYVYRDDVLVAIVAC